MKSKLFFVTLIFLAALAAVIWVEYGSVASNVPKVRVGPLTQTLEGEWSSVKLLALGDTGTGNENQMKVAAAMEEFCRQNQLDGILLLGDNFYMHGVKDTNDDQWVKKIEKPYGTPCLAKLNIYPVLGNHDYHWNPEAQILYSRINSRWQMPNRFYSVEFGSLLHFVGFDSQTSEFCFQPEFCAVDFLRDRLRSEATWHIVTAHHPLASSSGKNVSYRGGWRRLLLRPFVCDEADFWVAGHSHHMEHIFDEDCQLDIVVSGGGGGDLAPLGEPYEGSKFAAPRHGFSVLTFEPTRAQVEFYSTENEQIYQYQRNR